MAVEPPATSFCFPAPDTADERGCVVVGGDLSAGTLLAAYRSGLFPMRRPDGELAWWSPDPRGVLRLDALRVSRSLRKAAARFRVTVDTAFDAVVAACAARRPGEYEWITPEIAAAYGELHRLGWAHSVETWSLPTGDEPPRLVGGLYGVSIGGFFGGESMFHRVADASKVALVALVELLRADAAAGGLIDVQWLTPHLASLGAVEVPRPAYLAALREATAMAPPRVLAPGATPGAGG